MKRIGPSGTRYLIKRHVRGCAWKQKPSRCDCSWSARYRGEEVVLWRWAAGRPTVDPHTKDVAEQILTRFRTAVDERRFDPAGELPAIGTAQTLAAFTTEWKTHHADKRGHTSTSLPSMLGVLADGRLGRMTLADLAGSPQTIEEWLDAEAKARPWSDATWVRYYQLLRSIFNRACRWTVNDKPRMAKNPMLQIVPRVVHAERESSVRFEDPDIEARLLAACDQLDAPFKVTRAKIDQATADKIRKAVAKGASQKDTAAKFKVSTASVCDIVNGKIWNPDRRKWSTTTRGVEMRRRVLCAFSTGLRVSEMLDVQIKHVDWAHPKPLVDDDGQPFNGYRIVLPSRKTKGGKTTGKIEVVRVATAPLARELEARRFALRVKDADGRMKPNPEAFIFGTEEGRRPQGFRRAWRLLFTKAGLDFGRDKGIVWHTARHEFISRVADTTGDGPATKDAGRLKDWKTLNRYLHVRDERAWSVVAGLGRRG